jgi:inosine-uridine nucleoside N-ribohydrolase
MNRRHFIKSVACATLVAATPPAPKPVILATDIGDDIDDTWALGFLMKCPELDVKLVLTEYGKSQYRAKLVAKSLTKFKLSQVPIGLGPDLAPHGTGPLAEWVADYDLRSYPGAIYTDGIGAMIEVIMESPDPVEVICIGPMPNIAAALDRQPKIAQRARFVGMDGSIRLGYGGAKTPSPEWNVKADPKAAQKALSAPWEITITPLDTCGLVTLDGDRYKRILEAHNPVATTIVENYRLWSKSTNNPTQAERHSSTLFDPVAVYLAVSQRFCVMERLGVRVTDDGFTVIDDQAKKMNVATQWKNLDNFRDLLTTRLTDGMSWIH